MFIVVLLIQPPKVIVAGIYMLGGMLLPAIYFFLIRIGEEIILLEQKRLPGLRSPARRLRRSFPSAGTSRGAGRPRGCAEGELRAPRPCAAARTLKASAGQSGGPGGCRLLRKGFPVPSAPAEEKYRRWGRGRKAPPLPGTAAPGHSSPPPQAFRAIFV